MAHLDVVNFLRAAMLNAKGGSLERANHQFSQYSEAELDLPFARSSKTNRQVWQEYKDYRARWVEANSFLEQCFSYEFPLYLMRIGDGQKFLPLHRAGVVYDSGFERVEIGGLVLETDLSVRKITSDEEKKIKDIADRNSDSR